MKLSVHAFGDLDMKVVESDISGPVTLSKVFNPVTILTEDGHRFHVCQRGSGLEIKCPDGAVAGVMIRQPGERVVRGLATNATRAEGGETYLEFDGKFVG